MLSNLVSWVQSHWGLIAGTLVVLANEAIAWNPNWKSNSLVQFLLKLTPPASKVN